MAHRSIPLPPPDDPLDRVEGDDPLPTARGIPPAWRLPAGAGVWASRPAPTRWAAAAVALAVAAAIGWWFLRPSAPPIESTMPMAGSASGVGTGGGAAVAGSSSTMAGSTTTSLPPVVVQAAGAVAKPGVYRLPPGSRVDDLVREAGGLADTADGARINLAAPLVDGERVWVPAIGQAEVPEVVAGGGGASPPGTVPGGSGPGAGSSGGSGAPVAPVNINTATEAELEALPGVGPATAAAIAAQRDQVGRFSAVEDLLEVRGIGEAKLEQMRPYVVL